MQEAVKQGTITMPYKITNVYEALDILCVTLPLNKHSNKRVSQQRVIMHLTENLIDCHCDQTKGIFAQFIYSIYLAKQTTNNASGFFT